jgi:nicotinate phosphoribosyltransferase
LAGSPRLKLSQDIEKVTIPCRKNLYRLYGRDGKALCDLLIKIEESEPVANSRILCRHPFLEKKRAYVTPSSVQCMYNLYWADGEIKHPLPTWEEARAYARQQIDSLRKDHRRYLNPTPYKVSVSDDLYSFMHELWMKNVPIGELE